MKSVSMYEIQFLNARQNDILVGWQYIGCFTSCQNRCCQPSTSYLFPFHLFYAARDACYTSSEEITVIHHHIGAEEEWWWCWHLSKSMQIWSLNSINCNVGTSVTSNFSRLVTRLARLLYCWHGWAGCCAFNLPVRLVTSWVRGGKIIAKENNGNWIMLRRRLLYTNSLSQLIIIQEERNVQKEEQFNFKSTQYVDTRHPPYWRK